MQCLDIGMFSAVYVMKLNMNFTFFYYNDFTCDKMRNYFSCKALSLVNTSKTCCKFSITLSKVVKYHNFTAGFAYTNIDMKMISILFFVIFT